ncbi:MAG: ankyrin repeat domain-containing protein [Coxiellaceae bacterium]|nr:ankyrin repeat domain-containing protein [Coxiellaceae bacterium]
MPDMTWEEAKNSKNANNILKVLLTGYIPENLQELITINDHSEKTRSIVDIVLRFGDRSVISRNNREIIATRLLDSGAAVPEYVYPREQYANSLSRWLSHLSDNPTDFFLAYYADPSIVTQRGEDGKTILHHAVSSAVIMGGNNQVEKLLNMSEVDLQAEDNDGNTFLHIAALYCNRRDGAWCLNKWTEIAARKNFNFDAINHDGVSVLHLATTITYTYMWRRPTLPEFLGIIETAKAKININLLDGNGRSALWHAAYHLYFPEIDALLKAGISPKVCARPGDPESDLITCIETRIQQAEMMIRVKEAVENNTLIADWDRYGEFILNSMSQADRNELPQNQDEREIMLQQHAQASVENVPLDKLKERLATIKEIKTKIEEYPVAEIRKNARVIGQAKRSNTNTLFRLPPELLVDITGRTGGKSLTEEEKINLAIQSFKKPEIKR